MKMSSAAKDIIDAALKLDPAERVHVAEAIWESVDDDGPAEDVERLWREELPVGARRSNPVKRGSSPSTN